MVMICSKKGVNKVGGSIRTLKLLVELQENGIMRLNSTGRLLARLIEDDEVNFENLSKNDDDIGQFSDGYHTFDELYFHRMILFAVICKTYKDKAWKSKLHADGTMFNNYFIVGVTTPKGDYTYHYHMEHWGHFEGIKELDYAPVWDGHKPGDINRLLSLLG